MNEWSNKYCLKVAACGYTKKYVKEKTWTVITVLDIE